MLSMSNETIIGHGIKPHQGRTDHKIHMLIRSESMGEKLSDVLLKTWDIGYDRRFLLVESARITLADRTKALTHLLYPEIVVCGRI